VNAAIAKGGGKSRLVYAQVGGYYFYFDHVGERGAPSEPIQVSPDSTVDELLGALKVAEVEEALNPRPDW
jgi:hypothetical protein